MKKELIVISAVWCPSCLIIKKELKKLKEEINNINITQLDYDLDDQVKDYNVGEKLPVIILIDENKKEIGRLIGEKNYKEILEFIRGDN